MRLLHILFFLAGVQLLINGAFFSSSLLTAIGAVLICLFIITAKRKPLHQPHENLWPGYHQGGHSKETYFAPLALLALIAGGLAYLFLPLSDLYEKTALTILGMSFFYLLLTLFIHGRKATMKNVLGILFGLLFLLGLGRMAFLWNNDYAGKWNQLVTSLNTSSTGDTTPLTGDNNWTGTSALTGGDLTGSVLPPVGTGNTVTTPTKEGLTYGQLVPYIVEKYGLSAAGKPDVGFTYLTANDERYQAFKAGHYNKFFSTTINPNSQVTCDTYVIFIGLAEQWDLSYTAENVHEVFWNEAQNKGILYGCKKGEFVRWANLF